MDFKSRRQGESVLGPYLTPVVIMLIEPSHDELIKLCDTGLQSKSLWRDIRLQVVGDSQK